MVWRKSKQLNPVMEFNSSTKPFWNPNLFGPLEVKNLGVTPIWILKLRQQTGFESRFWCQTFLTLTPEPNRFGSQTILEVKTCQNLGVNPLWTLKLHQAIFRNHPSHLPLNLYKIRAPGGKLPGGW